MQVLPALLLVASTCCVLLPAATAGTSYNHETQRLSIDYTDTEAAVVFTDIANARSLDLSIVGPATQRIGIVMDNVELGTAFLQLRQNTALSLSSDGTILRALPRSGAIQSWDYDCDLFVRPTEPATEPRFSVAATNKPVREILRDIADRRELNLVIPEKLVGTATLHLRATTWREAFRELLFPLGYTLTEEEGILRIHRFSTVAPTTAEPPAQLSTNRLLRALLFSHGPSLLLFGLGLVVHAMLAFGAVRTPLPRPALFAPKWLWVLLILVAGVLPLLAYWLFHYSSFAVARKESAP